jgi:hypothetical protein
MMLPQWRLRLLSVIDAGVVVRHIEASSPPLARLAGLEGRLLCLVVPKVRVQSEVSILTAATTRDLPKEVNKA